MDFGNHLPCQVRYHDLNIKLNQTFGLQKKDLCHAKQASPHRLTE